MTILEILDKYWGHKQFRPLQEDIINSVLNGNDTLALLPTGGGKSVCFQVPALATEGICIVISPLIALMKDQVENLRKKGIKAAAVFSGMSRNEIDLTLDNCVYGDYKFLYVSPERLQTDIFKLRFQKMKPNLIAVDEAHCISQWGYDFRPPYLLIADLREIHSKVPFLALTATATPVVQKDIQKNLGFKKENIFIKSFERKNISYVVLRDDDKYNRMIEIFKKIPGTGIVYVRSRRKAKEIADLLLRNKISADYYHAGLPALTRNQKQDNWISGKLRVIVATNAFGMGIDKPDVRCVVHIDTPDNLEAYYQEAGRAGRDEKTAYAVLFFNKSDEEEITFRVEKTFPPLETIRTIYHALGNYLRIPVGNAKGVNYNFNINEFSKQYNLDVQSVYSSLKILEADEYISLTDSFFNPPRVHIKVNNMELYDFQVQQPGMDHFIKTLLRSYGGLFEEFVRINKSDLGKRAGIKEGEVVFQLNKLQQLEILDYEPQNDLPQLIFLRDRIPAQDLTIGKKNYQERKVKFVERVKAMIHYAVSGDQCRSVMLMNYFGEKNEQRCGACDYCRERNKLELNDLEYEKIKARVKELTQEKNFPFEKLVVSVNLYNNDKTIRALQWMVDNEILTRLDNGELKWSE